MINPTAVLILFSWFRIHPSRAPVNELEMKENTENLNVVSNSNTTNNAPHARLGIFQIKQKEGFLYKLVLHNCNCLFNVFFCQILQTYYCIYVYFTYDLLLYSTKRSHTKDLNGTNWVNSTPSVAHSNNYIAHCGFLPVRKKLGRFKIQTPVFVPYFILFKIDNSHTVYYQLIYILAPYVLF